MSELKTTYLGLELKNPLIAGASNLVNNVDNIRKLEDAGIAAIVFKSLFEEQVQYERAQLQDELDLYNERHAEMINIHPNLEHAGPKEHLVNIEEAKKAVNIPVIASLNAVYKETWIEYAKLLEETGVDALELNFYWVPRDMNKKGNEIEQEQLEFLKAVKDAVKIPVSVKLSPFYANPLNFISELDKAGADGFVVFNRLFQPDISTEKQEHVAPFHLSTKEDNRLPLRFAGLLYGNLKGNICSNSGILDGDDMIKMLLAGADCVQVVSTLYKNKFDQVRNMIDGLESWMKDHNYNKLDEFKGKLSNKSINDPFIYKRAQYVDILLKSEKILEKYPMP
ncbi:MAG: dihydroorotate dehydrogenase-like protein [Bacteroidales bacterium]